MARKIVLITGCSEGGIGNALCQAYARAGCHVFATARRLSAMDNLPSSVDKIQLDVLNEQDCKKAVQEVVDKVGTIDILGEARIFKAVLWNRGGLRMKAQTDLGFFACPIFYLVNNAGAGGTGALMDFPVDQAKAVFDTNLFAPMRLAQLVVPHMAKKKSGLIINIGSIVGVIPTPWAGVYATSKAAIHAWSEVLRMEVKGLGINVMLVAPGAITSGFGKKQADSFDLPQDSLYHSVAQRIMDRATMSQRADHTMPASKLAQGIVTRSLRSNPATYYTAGGKAFLFWILERLPRSWVWFVLARALGTNQVGK